MLKVQGLKKYLGDRLILESIDLELHDGEIGVILGESGSGKTTLLRCLSGLDSNYSGKIWIGKQEIFPQTAPSQRQLGYLFQNSTLFPHLSVQKNIEIALMHLGQKERQQHALEVMEICEISRYANTLPHQLSGGEQQRVALARSIASNPKLILMDEPFSSLDPQLRYRIRDEIKKLLRSLKITCVMVSHDVQEAYFMADKMGILKDGQIKQWSTSDDLYHRPLDPYIAEYLDAAIFLNVSANHQGDLHLAGHLIGKQPHHQNQPQLKLLVRPKDVILDDSSPVKATLIRKNFQGSHLFYELQTDDGTRLFALAQSERQLPLGQVVGVRFQLEQFICFRTD